MSSGGAGAHSDSAFELALDALFAATDLDALLAAGAHALVATTGASAAAVFLVEDGQVAAESWHPEMAKQRPEAAALRARVTEPSQGPGGSGAPAPAGWKAVPLAAHDRELGVAWLAVGDAETPADERMPRVARALACRIGAEREISRVHQIQARYERWFKNLDEQIRLLDRERQKFAAIVHSSDAAVFVTDLEGRIRWANSVMAEYPPGGASHWVGLPCQDACRRLEEGGEKGACGSCAVTQARDENAVVHREYRDLRDERARSIYLTALPIRGPHGQADEVMVMLQDLSDLGVLRASDARYRLLFERAGRAIVMVDPATRRIVLANAMACRMTGLSTDELLRLRLDELHPDSDWPSLAPHYASLIAGESREPQECPVRGRDGARRLAVITGTLTDLDGRNVLMLEMSDVTDTRRVEETLHMVEERLRTVVANCPIVLFAVDRDGVFTLSEGAGLQRLGLEPGQVVGQSVYDLYRDHPRILACIRAAIAGEATTEEALVNGLTFEARYSPLRDAAGAVVGAIGVATDVTERRRLEEQLRQAQRMEAIGRLAGGVAHDFNNLLAAILGHGELLVGRLEDSHPMRRSAEEIQKAAMRGAMLTRQLLAFGRKDALVLRVVDLNAVLADVEEMLRRLIGEDIQLECVRSPEPAVVRADQGQLEQVIVNLVVNARDAMPHGGNLRLEIGCEEWGEDHPSRPPTAPPGRYVVLAVTDSGCGMDSDTLAHVFEPFFTTKERGKGTGLGLATVYGIAEQFGGHVAARSEPGIGSTFRVCLPRSDEQVASPGSDAAWSPPRGGTETILLVEDEDAVRSTAREVLESSGYAVLEARDGVHALEVAADTSRTIHLLVTDVVMPRLGGGELAARLTSQRPQTRVLFISGYPDDAVVLHGVAEHGAAFLQKPFALGDLIGKVREVLDAPDRKAA